MEWNTALTRLVGCRYPIIQGAFGGFGTSALAVPVSEAGGLGQITAGSFRTPELLRDDIRRAKSMTDKPIAVNFSMGMVPEIDRMLDVVIEERVGAVFTAAYRADKYGRRAQEAGIPWVHKVATIKHAQAAERQGADAVVIVGLEGTGFKSPIQLPTLISITVARRLLKIPIVAAGGIGDARGFLSALGMGACGIYMGTAFMATTECPISQRNKDELVAAQPWDARVRDRALAPPSPEELARVMKLRETLTLGEWMSRLERVMLKEPAELDKRRQQHLAEGDLGEALRITGGSLAVGVIDRVRTCKELIDDIIQEAEALIADGAFPCPHTLSP